LSAASIEARAISAVLSSFACKETAAKQAHKVYSFTNLQSLIAFSHLFFSQKSNNMAGYGETDNVINPPSFLLKVT
jgi:hypothetical protein